MRSLKVSTTNPIHHKLRPNRRRVQCEFLRQQKRKLTLPSHKMESDSFDWNVVVRRFHEAFESTFSTSKKAHFDSVPPHLRIVDGARSRWSSLILMDAVIYLLDFQEFNSISRRAFNQQQVLYNCIVQEIRRACPNLFRRHIAAKGSTNTSHTGSPDDTLPFAALKTPWSSAAQLRRNLLSDPTSKSRDKFVGIVESLFKHPAFSLSDASLTGTFEKLVLKVAFVFKNVLVGDTPCATISSVGSSSGSSSSLRGKTKGKKRRFSTRGDSEAEDDDDDDVVETNGSTESSVDRAEPPRKVRYVTRSSTDGFRPSAAVTGEASPQCRYRVEGRAARQHMPLIRPDMRPVQASCHSAEPPDVNLARDQDDPARAGECVFDSTLFDDHHIGTDLDCEQWDFLDDWAWQHNAGPNVITYATLNSPRPSHPLPLHGAGFTLQGQPLTNASQHALSSFRSIAHTAVPSFNDFGRALESTSLPLWPEDHNRQVRGPLLSAPSDAPPTLTIPRSVPFPDNCASSMYSHRTAFYRPVTPEPPFRQLVSAVVEVPSPTEARERVCNRAPLSDSVLSSTSENTSWSDSDALSSCMTLDSQYVRAMGQLGVYDEGCEQGQIAVPCLIITDDVLADSDNLW